MASNGSASWFLKISNDSKVSSPNSLPPMVLTSTSGPSTCLSNLSYPAVPNGPFQ
jgi:hypothetical protein